MRICSSCLVAVLSSSLLATGCGDVLGPETVSRISVDIDRTILVEGETLPIRLMAHDWTGKAISSSEVTWISRDPSTVRLGDQVVEAVAPGVTWIVAEVRRARDSVRLRVRFRDLAEGEIGVRLQRDGGIRQAVSGYSVVKRQLTIKGISMRLPPVRTQIYTTLGRSTLRSPDDPYDGIGFPTDTVVWIMLDGEPTEGAHTLDGFTVVETPTGVGIQGAEGAALRIIDRERPGRFELFVPVEDVDLEFDEVVRSPEPVDAGGVLRGAVAFEAAGLVVEIDPETGGRLIGPVSDTTISVYAEFATPLAEWPSGMAETVIDGGGFEDDTTYGISTPLHPIWGALEMPVLGVRGLPTAPDPNPDEVVTAGFRVRLEDAAVGEIPVEAITPGDFDDEGFAPGTWATVRINVRTGGLAPVTVAEGYSTGGTFSIQRYHAPSGEAFGILRGVLTLDIALWADGGPTGETMRVRSDFIRSIHPTCEGGADCPGG